MINPGRPALPSPAPCSSTPIAPWRAQRVAAAMCHTLRGARPRPPSPSARLRSPAMSTTAATPDYLPARMLNEFVYCPRLFYYEWVEGVFVENRETVEGALRHSNLDARANALASAEELTDDDHVHARSVTLSSNSHRLIAKIDLVEAE